MKQNAIVTRRELYNRIWSKTCDEVGKGYGISGRAVRERCQENDIPVPSKGYWVRLRAGRADKRPPLPPISGKAPHFIKLYGFARIKGRLSNRQNDPDCSVKVKALVPAPKGTPVHPLTLRTQRLLSGAKADDAGILISQKALVNHLLVSSRLLPRALLYLDALFGSLEQPPFEVTWPGRSDAQLQVMVAGEPFTCSLKEIVESNRGRKSAPPRLDQAAQVHSWDYHLTGILRLTFSDLASHRVSHRWTDRKYLPIEGCLGDVLETLVSVTRTLHRKRAGVKTWRQQWADQRRIEDAESRQRLEPARRIELVRQFAGNWAESAVLRDFLTQLSRAISRMKKSQDRRQGREMVSWVRCQLDKEDPVQNIKKLLKGFESA